MMTSKTFSTVTLCGFSFTGWKSGGGTKGLNLGKGGAGQGGRGKGKAALLCLGVPLSKWPVGRGGKGNMCVGGGTEGGTSK